MKSVSCKALEFSGDLPGKFNLSHTRHKLALDQSGNRQTHKHDHYIQHVILVCMHVRIRSVNLLDLELDTRSYKKQAPSLYNITTIKLIVYATIDHIN